MEQLPGTNAIIYPQEIWNGFSHREVRRPPVASERIETNPS
jgi:hypothetical protein